MKIEGEWVIYVPGDDLSECVAVQEGDQHINARGLWEDYSPMYYRFGLKTTCQRGFRRLRSKHTAHNFNEFSPF